MRPLPNGIDELAVAEKELRGGKGFSRANPADTVLTTGVPATFKPASSRYLSAQKMLLITARLMKIRFFTTLLIVAFALPRLRGEVVAEDAKAKATFLVQTDPARARISFLSWDTEGGNRAKVNLLRSLSSVGLRIKQSGDWRDVNKLETQVEKGQTETCYRITIARDAKLEWRILSGEDGLTMVFNTTVSGLLEGLELRFPFDPLVVATTVLPSNWDGKDNILLPAIISAPDFGQILLSATPNPKVKGRLIGSRANHFVDFILELTPPRPGEAQTLSFKPLRLPTPSGLNDESLWPPARRGWFNAFQPSAQWGDPTTRFSAPAGILANNVVSDPVSCLLHLWADQALLTPKFSSEIQLPHMVRRTVDWWLNHRTKPSGEVFAYGDHADMLDANASPLIAAWDYVEATSDRQWLAQRIERLEFIADYLVKRDVDNDGLVESIRSGNYGTLKEPMRAGSAYDTINAGHKDAYCNALTYRALRCLADLEKQLKRRDQQKRYSRQADRLKAAYSKTFFNPNTGWLAWWKSEDGGLHDLSSPMISSLAICYGLVEPRPGRKMMNQLWARIEASGFNRFDLGVPITLTPVRRGDYLTGFNGCGVPAKEDGSDTFGQYLNGGCLVSDAVYFITALNIVGERAKADRILKAMVERQERGMFLNGGGFQNGVVNEYPRGAEFYTWDGKTCGYEGHLTYSFAFLQAILLRESDFRAQLFRPLK